MIDYDEMEEIFDANMSNYGQFADIANKRSNCCDIHAFLLLDALCPGERHMVDAAEHDIIYLAPDPTDLAEVATREQIIELRLCGVFIDSETSSLAMFR